MGRAEFEVKKDDIDPSDFSDEELKDIIFNGLFCAKIVERLGQDERSLRAAYDMISNFDRVPHDRTPSDLIQEEVLSDF